MTVLDAEPPPPTTHADVGGGAVRWRYRLGSDESRNESAIRDTGSRSAAGAEPARHALRAVSDTSLQGAIVIDRSAVYRLLGLTGALDLNPDQHVAWMAVKQALGLELEIEAFSRNVKVSGN